MAYLATNEFAGTGAVMQVEINFTGNRPDAASGTTPYFKVADVLAEVITPATSTTAQVSVPMTLTSINANTFRTAAAIPVGRVLRVYRKTEDRYPLVDFKALQLVTELDLDNLTRQAVFMAGEAKDAAGIARSDASSAIIFAVLANIAANQAVAAANAAVVTAGQAASNASSAVAVASGAAQVAGQALSTANGAATVAGQASTAATTAIQTANAASLNAADALTQSGQALSVSAGAVDSAAAAAAFAQQIKDLVDSSPSAAALAVNLNDKTDPAKGAALSGFDGDTVAAALLEVKTLPDYAALLAYNGLATTVCIKRGGIKGTFYVDNTVTASDGGTTFVGAKKWRRDYSGTVQFAWWNIQSGQDGAAALLKALALGPVELPVGETRFSPVDIPTGSVLKGRGKTNTVVRPFAGTSNVFNINGANAVRISDMTIFGGATAKDGEDSALVFAKGGYYNLTLCNLRVIQGSQCGIILSGGVMMANERSQVYDCDVYSNKYQGIRLSDTSHIDVLNNQVHDNGHHGIALQPMSGTWVAYALDDVLMHGNRVYSNVGHGIYVLPLIFGGTLTNPQYSFTADQYCRNVRASQNEVYNNSASGIMAGGFDCTYTGNICRGNGTIGDGYSGIVVAGYSVTVTGNSTTGNSTYGIDIGGSYNCTIVGNTISYNAVGKSFGIGLNIGASSGCTITGNTVSLNGTDSSNHFQIMVAGWDGDGVYAYELQGGFNVIANNNVRCYPNNYGIYIRRNVQYAKVCDNYIAQCLRVNALINETDFSESVNVIDGNTHDISTVAGGVVIASASALVIDDYNSEFIVTGTTNISTMLTKSNSDNAGKIVSARVTAPGSGYTSKPTVTISGGGGTGATATAEISRSGKLMGISIVNKGSGYTSNPTIAISGGGGTGGTAAAVVGMKNHTGRQVTLQFEGTLTVQLPGMNTAYTAAGGSTLTVRGRRNGNGQWLEISRSS